MASSAVEEWSPGDGESEDTEASPLLLDTVSAHGQHASLMTMCEWLHDIIVGNAAAEMLENLDDIPDEGGLWVPPSYGWMFSAINVGRKDRGANGERLRLPVRLEWDTPIVVLTRSALKSKRKVSWLTYSMGHSGAGDCTVGLSESLFDPQTVITDAFIPTEALVPMNPRHQIIAELEALVETKRESYWNLMANLEPLAVTYVKKAHSWLSRSVGSLTGFEDMPLLDRTAQEQVRCDFMYGNDAEPVSKLERIVARLLDPASMRKVDPLRYLNAAMRRDTQEAVRQAVGDNRVGVRLRDLAKNLGSTDVEVVVAAARELWPKDRISDDRVIAALSVRPDPMASRWHVTHTDGSEVFSTGSDVTSTSDDDWRDTDDGGPVGYSFDR